LNDTIFSHIPLAVFMFGLTTKSSNILYFG